MIVLLVVWFGGRLTVLCILKVLCVKLASILMFEVENETVMGNAEILR